MNKMFQNIILAFLLLAFSSIKAISDDSEIGNISGTLLLDDSWSSRIYVSYIDAFEKEYTISNNLIVTSTKVDSLGNFNIRLDKIPLHWSLLRLHVVKKGVSPNSLIIGSRNENFYFLIAKRDSEIKLFNTIGTPIFVNTKVEGASYMNTFEYVRKLSNYVDNIDYKDSLIERAFIQDVVAEKLKNTADTCKNALVSLYALYQADIQSSYKDDHLFYDNYLSKWQNEESTYFKSFRSRFPKAKETPSTSNSVLKYSFLLFLIIVIILTGGFLFRRKGVKIEALSVQERKVFDLLRGGLSNKEISAECNIELTTVKSHVSSIYSKLKIKSRKEALNLKLK